MTLSRSTHVPMCLSLETFNVHHKDWLTCSGGTDRPGELCYIFSISNDLTQMVNFPTRIPECDSRSSALLDVFIYLFPLSITFFVFMHDFDSISSNIGEPLSIDPCSDVLIFGDFNVHHKDQLTYSCGTDRPGELRYNFFYLK